MEEKIKEYELLCKEVRFQISYIDDFYEFDFTHLVGILNEMRILQDTIKE